MRPVRRRRARNGSPTLRLMPMIDVVFLLLIYFLCVTKLTEREVRLKGFLPRLGIHPEIEEDVDLQEARLRLRMENGACRCEYPDDLSPRGYSRFASQSVLDFQTKRMETVPDWQAVRAYLVTEKQFYDEHGLGPDGLPVVLDFTYDVPWKHVVSIMDICADLELDNLRVAAPELAFR